jgi:hypothetical protein
LGLDALATAFGMTEDQDDEAAAMGMALLEAANEESEVVLVAYLGADDLPYQVEMRTVLAAEDIDAQILDPENFPAGMTLSFRFEKTEEAVYSAYGEPVDPAVAPEVAAAE